MAGSIVNLALRGFQFLFAVVILGLSVSLIKDHHFGSLPATLGFAAFVAGISIIGALVGIAASFVSMLEGPIGLIIDAVVALVNAVGGILMAIKMKGATCGFKNASNFKSLVENDMLNGGVLCVKGVGCGTFYNPDFTSKPNDWGKYLTHCRSAQADFVFMFLTVVVVIIAALMTFLRMKKGY